MSYREDMRKSWRSPKRSIRKFGGVILTFDPWKQFPAGYRMFASLFLFITKVLFFSTKKVLGGYT